MQSPNFAPRRNDFRARAVAAEAGLSDRVRFEVRDAAGPALAARYDLVTMFATLHDRARPVDALKAARRLPADTGAVLIADENVAEQFEAPANETDRSNYGWSILRCLPAGRTESPSAATGTVLRPDTLRRYAREAGFSRVAVLPIQHDFFRFYCYRLRR